MPSNISELEAELRELRAENRRLRKRVVELEGELDYIRGGRFVASTERQTFHRPDCKWADYIVNSGYLIEFSSHEEAVQAGYKPCKTCRA